MLDTNEMAAWVRDARAALGLTQQGLADALELDKSGAAVIASWEKARRYPSGPARVAMRLLLANHETKAKRKQRRAA